MRKEEFFPSLALTCWGKRAEGQIGRRTDFRGTKKEGWPQALFILRKRYNHLAGLP